MPRHDQIVRNLRGEVPGTVRMAVCRQCGHMAPLPVERIVKRFGDLCPVEIAMTFVKCAKCGQTCPEARVMRLCEPGCHRQRG